MYGHHKGQVFRQMFKCAKEEACRWYAVDGLLKRATLGCEECFFISVSLFFRDWG